MNRQQLIFEKVNTFQISSQCPMNFIDHKKCRIQKYRIFPHNRDLKMFRNTIEQDRYYLMKILYYDIIYTIYISFSDNKMQNNFMDYPEVQIESNNEFLYEQTQFELCPHCTRKFFKGKLVYHMKLCTADHPMTKSFMKIRTKRQKLSYHHLKNKKQLQIINNNNQHKGNYQRCNNCHSNLPFFLFQEHIKKCIKNLQSYNINKEKKKNLQLNFELPLNIQYGENNYQNKDNKNNEQEKQREQIKQCKNLKTKTTLKIRSTNHVHFEGAQTNSIVSRKLKNYSNFSKNPMNNSDHSQYTVKIRQDLSCFHKAAEVQQVLCIYCNRKFSNQASLRHIPICKNLKINQMKSIALKKQSKSQKYKRTNVEQIPKLMNLQKQKKKQILISYNTNYHSNNDNQINKINEDNFKKIQINKKQLKIIPSDILKLSSIHIVKNNGQKLVQKYQNDDNQDNSDNEFLKI